MSSVLMPLVVAASLGPTTDPLEHDADAPAPTAEVEASGAPSKPSVASRFAVTAAYYGETITHPGVALGGEFYAFERPRYKLIAASKAGMYLHPHSHGAAFLDAELGQRVTAIYGLYGDLFTGVGYMHSWPWGDIYERAADGGVQRKRNLGHARVKFGGGLGLGWDLSKNSVAPLSVFLRLDLFGEAPFNKGIALHGALMAGVIWRFGQDGKNRQ